MNHEPDTDKSVIQWIQKLKFQAQTGKDIKYERANAYQMPHFFDHLLTLAKEFLLWTAVMRCHYNSTYKRPTSCYVEWDFGEFKNNVFYDVHGPLRPDKLFRFHFEVLKAQALMAPAPIAKLRMQRSAPQKNKEGKNINTASSAVNTDGELPSFDENHLENPIHHSTPLNASAFLSAGRFMSVELEPSFQSEDYPPPEIVDPTSTSELWKVEPNSDLFELENWRNKGQIKDPALNSNIIFSMSNLSETKDAVEDPELNSSKEKNSLKQTVQISKKRPLDFKGRKPSKFFRLCPEIKAHQRAAVITAGKNIKKKLLLNGNCFTEPIIVNKRKYMLKNSCPFDSIIQILAALAIDDPDYLNYLEESSNETCGFILVFIDSGAVKHVYGQRCWLLKDFINPVTHTISSCANASPHRMRIIDVYSDVTEMWEFMMQNEPSLFPTRTYSYGNLEVKEVHSLLLNHKLIEENGFQELQSAIISHTSDEEQTCIRDNCGHPVSIKFDVNAHVYIELDVRKSSDLQQSFKCKVTDFPNNISLHGEKLRCVELLNLT